MSTEVEVLCNQAECDFQSSKRMAVVKDKMHVLLGYTKVSVSKG